MIMIILRSNGVRGSCLYQYGGKINWENVLMNVIQIINIKDNDLIESYRFKLINGKYVPYYDLINNKEIKDTSRWILKDL